MVFIYKIFDYKIELLIVNIDGFEKIIFDISVNNIGLDSIFSQII